MLYLHRIPTTFALIITHLIGKLTILVSFVLGSFIYWLSIGTVALIVWTLLLLLAILWKVVNFISTKIIARLQRVLAQTASYTAELARSVE